MNAAEAPLHLVKLCVGADSLEDLETWIAQRMQLIGEHVHTTRMTPRRGDEINAGGSLYWVIRGQILGRQRILGLEQRRGDDGIERCDIRLEPHVVPVEPRPRRPFQGWRYLTSADAPPDLVLLTSDGGEMPVELSGHLRSIGLI